MTIVDQNPELEGAGGAAEPTEPKEPTAEPKEPTEPTSDPLDDIKDPVARADAKKARAIIRRNAEKHEEHTAPANPSNLASKDDLAKLVTADAKKMVSDQVIELWDELLDVPLGGFDPMDAESIAKNMTQRLVIYAQEHPDKIDPTLDLTATPGIRGKGGKPPVKPEKDLPGWKEPKQPDQWYSGQ